MLKIDALQCAKDLGINYNVTFRVLDAATGNLVSEFVGHNQATNSMLTGIAHYLRGDGILNQAQHMLSRHIPRYISLGTMGLVSQDEEIVAVPTPSGVEYVNTGLPAGIGDRMYENDGRTPRSEAARFQAYIDTMPGYGADGYDVNRNNGRTKMGLGPMFANRASANTDTPRTVDCELISDTFPRAAITYREIVPETHAEIPETIDIIYSAMISTGALAQFREPDKDYIFITEAGLWSDDVWSSSASNGLLAGYRIAPPDEKNWDMTQAENREILKRNIIKVRKNQVVQVIWKIQIGSHRQLIGKDKHCDCTCPSSDCPCHGNKPPAPEYPKLSLNILQDNVTLNPDETITLALDIITTYSDGHTERERWNPNTSETHIIWSSNNPAKMSVNSNGTVTARAAGEATITAKLSNDNLVYDTCKVMSKIDLPLDDTVITYALFSTGSITLGARAQVTANQLAVKERLVWEASGDPDGVVTGIGDNAAMYLLATDTSAARPAIVSNGWNYFDIDVYAPSNVTMDLSNYPSPNDIFRDGSLKVLPATYELPSIRIIHVATDLSTLPDVDATLGYTVVITEQSATILSPTQPTSSSPFVQLSLSDGRKVSGYLVGAVSSTNVTATYREGVATTSKVLHGYGGIHMNSSENAQVHVYVEPGNYAIEELTHTGNFAYFEFVGAQPSTPVFMYVQKRMELSNDGYIINKGNTRSGLIYCDGANLTEADGNLYPAFSCGTHNELRLYVEAPNGTINIRNNTVVRGCLYAKNLVLGNDVQVIIE